MALVGAVPTSTDFLVSIVGYDALAERDLHGKSKRLPKWERCSIEQSRILWVAITHAEGVFSIGLAIEKSKRQI